ncbi:FMN-binding negative transcriptional regulator [Sediminibacterium roseum]|uniref:FMN-binding negative transcriptional regulator n=1 Tax=Sediminibacterium roseum TaxID=1978412 RepID=A0ABW9ZVS0_9BACT|nr:FMN-binding negative transcriptional regulator [Sediminibacterium roseum]NCI51235.1 FMN-binding negative transcriptional regulator [Sediminibacterium roseum]
MYNLPYYKEKDAAVVIDFIRQNPFGILMGVDAEQRPVATQVPFLFEEREGVLYLRGHMMKGNDHHKAFLENSNALVLFTGPHCYVSASWYSNPQQGSTWNYMTVHAKGEFRFLDDSELPGLLNELTAFYEKEDSAASYQHIPQDYISRMVKAISAFEIKVTSMDHVFKLSQGRDKESFDNIVSKLSAGDANEKAIAAEMEKRKEKLFA